jgi:hypothetical protein
MEMVLMANKGMTYFKVIMRKNYSVPCEATARVFIGGGRQKESKPSGENKPRFFLIKWN